MMKKIVCALVHVTLLIGYLGAVKVSMEDKNLKKTNSNLNWTRWFESEEDSKENTSDAIDWLNGLGDALTKQRVSDNLDIEVIFIPETGYDNFAVLLKDKAQNKVILVDAPNFEVIDKVLVEKDWGQLDYILTTHSHGDHVAGHQAFKDKYNCTIYGRKKGVAADIPALDIELEDGDSFNLGSLTIKVYENPGHTADSISFYFPDQKIAFTGDTLLTMKAGQERCQPTKCSFETYWGSMQKLLAALPDDTAVYSGHEVATNAACWITTMMENQSPWNERMQAIFTIRNIGGPTIPTLMKHEKLTNLFLNIDKDYVKGLYETPTDIFGAIERTNGNDPGDTSCAVYQ